MTLNEAAIVSLIEKYEKESRAFRNEALRFCWYMRGGITYADAMNLSQLERDLINDLVKDNMETTKKTGLPFF